MRAARIARFAETSAATPDASQGPGRPPPPADLRLLQEGLTTVKATARGGCNDSCVIARHRRPPMYKTILVHCNDKRRIRALLASAARTSLPSATPAPARATLRWGSAWRPARRDCRSASRPPRPSCTSSWKRATRTRTPSLQIEMRKQEGPRYRGPFCLLR